MNKTLQNLSSNYKFQKWKLSILALFLIFSTVSCKQNSAEYTLSQYLDYTFMDNDGKKAYELITCEDKKYISRGEFIMETKRKNIFNENFLKSYKNQFSYEILETSQSNSDTVTLKVIFRKPNTNALLNEIVNYTMAASSSKISGRNKHRIIDQKLSKIIAKNDLKIEVETKEFTLIKENKKFKILLNLNPSKQPRIVHNNYGRY